MLYLHFLRTRREVHSETTVMHKSDCNSVIVTINNSLHCAKQEITHCVIPASSLEHRQLCNHRPSLPRWFQTDPGCSSDDCVPSKLALKSWILRLLVRGFHHPGFLGISGAAMTLIISLKWGVWWHWALWERRVPWSNRIEKYRLKSFFTM